MIFQRILNNVVIIIRVDESPQAPHAIQNSTRVYIRTGSITQPYELADIDRIEYMLKRRADSQIVTRQILDRTEARIEFLAKTDEPTLTVIARPVFPYRPVISTGDIHNFAMENRFFGTNLSKVAGGVAEGFSPRTLTRGDHDSDSYTYLELNEYGIIYNRSALIRESSRIPVDGNNGTYLIFPEFVWKIGTLIHQGRFFYEKCGYLGNIEITAKLRQIFGEKLKYANESHYKIEEQRSADSEVSASTQYLPRDLVKREKFIEVVDELAGQLLWAFNVHVSDPQNRRDMVEHILIRNSLLEPRSK